MNDLVWDVILLCPVLAFIYISSLFKDRSVIKRFLLLKISPGYIKGLQSDLIFLIQFS